MLRVDSTLGTFPGAAQALVQAQPLARRGLAVRRASRRRLHSVRPRGTHRAWGKSTEGTENRALWGRVLRGQRTEKGH